MTGSDELHHLVSRGYQQNFADETKRICLLGARSGVVVDEARAIKSNWAVPGFNTYTSSTSIADARLERAFAKIERSVLDQIRRVAPTNLGRSHLSAIYNLFAIHLVRSESFETAHERIAGEVRDALAGDFEGDANLTAVFAQDFGRRPRAGEMTEIASSLLDRNLTSREGLVESLVRNHNRLAEMLSKFRVQVVTTSVNGPGFILGDVPVVHANSTTGQYGFRDRLALGDADFVMAPLTRWTAVCLSVHPRRHVELKTKKQVQLVNSAFVRAALREVACHPDDRREAQRVCRNVDRLPLSRLLHVA